jgi:uncharacterized membrane protein YhaH (DUF805 family)
MSPPLVVSWPVRDWVPNLFTFRARVDQRHYAAFGVSLMLVKYVVEALVILAVTGKAYTPLDFVNPLLSAREQFTSDSPWLGMAWLLWTLPFLWIAVTMSVRRAAYLNLSPWLGLLVLVPVVNLVTMVVLACIPDRWSQPIPAAEQHEREIVEAQLAAAYAPPLTDPFKPRDLRRATTLAGIVAALVGLVGGAIFLVAGVIVSVYVINSYGAFLFFGTPVVTGALAAYVLNAPGRVSLPLTLAHGILTMTLACCAFLFIGLEGAICIIMAIPIMVPLGLLGTFIGYGIALGLRSRQNEYPGMLGAMLLLPLFGTAERWMQPSPTLVNMTAIDIDAPPERVWQHVVQFSDITETPEWYFQFGIASPLRARIDGRGVGAIRHCEFTTGEFVEPVTTWDEPRRLAFDVTEQPEPMAELSPYRHIHPPHLDGSFRSLRGEFLLVPLSDGRTRLEGRTWYQVKIYPLAYWTIWTDAVLHRIHGRVLRHIKAEAESNS